MSLFGGISLPGRPDPENVRRLDLLPLSQIRRMMRVGVAIDREWLWQLSSDLETRKSQLRQDIVNYVPPEKLEEFVGESGDDLGLNVESAEQIAHLLFKLLRVGAGRRLKATKSGKRISTGKKQLEMLKRDHPIVPLVLEYREVSKLKGTFCDALPQMALHHLAGECPICGLHHRADHWRIHGTINTTRTVAGRLSMKKPNLQQIPSRTKTGREVRKGFVAGPGKRLLSCDFSHFHFRLVAHLANEPHMIQVFREGKDIHVETARRAFRLGPDEVPDKITQRDPSKTTGFFMLNRGGPPGLLDVLLVNFALAGLPAPDWLTLDWCAAFIRTWFGLYEEIEKWFEIQDYRARRYGIVWCPFGRVRRVPEVRSCHERIRAAGLRQGGNHPLIGWEAGIYKIAQARVEARFDQLRADGVGVEAVIPVHDELLIEVDEDWAGEVGEVVKYEMEQALVDEQTGELHCRVPIVVEGKETTRWQKD